jgi:DNA-binding protein HU-beta
MNRSELIEAVSGHTGLTTKQSEAALAAVVYEITAGVRSGNPVRITGFGSFKLRQRAARKGRNPQTGAPVKVKASKGIGFTPGVRLKADLNSRSAPAKPAALAAPAKKAVATTAAPTTTAKKAPAKAAAVKKTTVAKKAAPVKKAVARG